MTNSSRRAISAYVQTGIETGVPEADAHRLVLMLFEGALTTIADAKLKLARGDIPGRGQAISKAISIIEQGLRGSLDTDKGGEIGSRLDGLYEYICGRLLQANLRGDSKLLDEAAALLIPLQAAWAQIRPLQPELA
jgi:flagellar protein FliS